MDKRSIILVVSVFVLIVVGMFMYAYLKRTEIAEPVVVVPKEEVLPYSNITRIDAKHFYIDGVHTFAGQVELPTPCDLLEVGSTVAESYPEQVTLNFTVINNSAACAQVITAQRFKVSASASAEASVQAMFMGRKVELNLIPAAAGETPEEFEVFIKG